MKQRESISGVSRPAEPGSRARPRLRGPTLAAGAVAAACTLGPVVASAEPSLQDYRYFRALSIDLQGRLPARDEISAFEKEGFDLDGWIEERLTGGRYAERVRRVYMDLLRLEVGATFVFQPRPIVVRRVNVIGPDNKDLPIYYRHGQRRPRVETDGMFCMTSAEAGLQFSPNGIPTPGAGTKKVTQAMLDANTVLVKPWWLYRDYAAANPTDRYDAAEWASLHPGYQPADGLVKGLDGLPVTQIRICKEEAQKPAFGTVFATGLVSQPAPGEQPPYGRLTHLPRDTAFAKEHKGDPIECASGTALVNSADCGCGIGLERCVPGATSAADPQAFVMPTDMPLGRELPFESKTSTGAEWSRQAWAAEASAFIDDIVAKDLDFREILTSRATVVNGPATQFHRFFGGSGCCTDTNAFGYVAPKPLTDPASMPSLLPHDMVDFVRVEDRGPLASGILTMPIFLTKYGTRRARAHVLYSAFLCKEFTSQNSELVPSEEPDLTKRSGCKDCHATLEPMAAHFARIRENDWVYLPVEEFPVSNPLCKANAQGVIPTFCKGYYDPAFTTTDAGELRGAHASPANAAAGPGALAQQIVDSDEFPLCVAANIAGSFLGRPLGADDEALHQALSKELVDGQFRVRALVAAIVKSEAYRLANDRLNPEEQ